MSDQSWTYLFGTLCSGVTLSLLYWEWQRRHGRSARWQDRVGSFTFITYFLWVATTLWVPFQAGTLAPKPGGEAQTFPLLLILNLVADTADRLAIGTTPWSMVYHPALSTVLIILLSSLPVGLYLATTGKFRRARDAWRASLAFWLLIEIWRASGLWGLRPPATGFDVDNILVASLGGLIGYYLYPTVQHWLYTPGRARPEAITNWRRVASFLLDCEVVYLTSRILQAAFPGQPIPWTEIVVAVYFILIPALSRGATVAKAAVFLRLSGGKNQPPTVGRLWIRYVVLLGPYLLIYRLLYLPALAKESRVILGTALLAYLIWTTYYLAMIALDPEHRSLHERLSGLVNRNAWRGQRSRRTTLIRIKR